MVNKLVFSQDTNILSFHHTRYICLSRFGHEWRMLERPTSEEVVTIISTDTKV
jgi:N-dimethylarginine dimethylaminohydrolase